MKVCRRALLCFSPVRERVELMCVLVAEPGGGAPRPLGSNCCWVAEDPQRPQLPEARCAAPGDLVVDPRLKLYPYIRSFNPTNDACVSAKRCKEPVSIALLRSFARAAGVPLKQTTAGDELALR